MFSPWRFGSRRCQQQNFANWRILNLSSTQVRRSSLRWSCVAVKGGPVLKIPFLPYSPYSSGWSHGKEKLKANLPDMNKASFYFNPLTDIPGTEEERRLFPLSYPCNKWPSAGANLPTLEPSAKRLGCLMKDVAVLLAPHIDDYASSLKESYGAKTLYNALADTEKVKGRLLYYYPLSPEQNDSSEDSWIGWHNDSGFLTCLAGDIYLTPDGTTLPTSPASSAGLYVVDRQDRVCKIEIPDDCMAVQIGECTQILTGGAVIATPHCVRGAPGLARASLACFIDTPPSFKLSSPSASDKGSNDEGILGSTVVANSSRVPPLAKRWNDGMTFGDFLEKTFKMYYDSNQ
jgi:isopenicillin N synthase-like dioxygenase